MHQVTQLPFPHTLIHISNNINSEWVVQQLFEGNLLASALPLQTLKGALYSTVTINQLIDEELRHEQVAIITNHNKGLATMSSGEQKRALLTHILQQNPNYIIVDNVFDNLDVQAQTAIVQTLQTVAQHTAIVQIMHRRKDILPFIQQVYCVNNTNNFVHQLLSNYLAQLPQTIRLVQSISPPLYMYPATQQPLVEMVNVQVSYNQRPILHNINWQILAGEFWHLIGPNGSGKSTLLSMITGDNPKAFGQNLFLFGQKKGSGETVWEIKAKIGYFTPIIAHQFDRLDTIEQMLLSGFFDSIGLYIVPTDLQKQLAQQWLHLLGLYPLKNKPFRSLSLGQQRIVLIARAMVKHPPLLILDEPASGLDDENTALLVSLINKMATESNTAIVYVSHRAEPGLQPKKVFSLTPTNVGSIGRVQ